MKANFFQSIGGKILLVLVLAGLVSILSVAIFASANAQSALMTEAYDKLRAVEEIKKHQLNNFIKETEEKMRVISATRDVVEATKEFILYHQEMNISATGNYDMSSSAQGLTRTYDEIYKRANAELSKYCDIFGYYDIFIICAKHGHVMYTWAKEADLGENISAGKYKTTHLATMWSEVTKTGKMYMTDIKKYAPSGGAPAMFIGAPVKDETGEMIAVVALQVAQTRINAIMQEKTGMGESGETYLVGEDTLMRSDSRFSTNSTVLVQEINTVAGRSAKEDKESMGSIIKDYRGVNVLSVYSHLGLNESFGTDFEWSIIAEIDEEEVKRPIMRIILFIVGIAIVVFIALIIVAVVFSRSISRPLNDGVEIALHIAKGDLTHDIDPKHTKRQDEIGNLARGLQQMINDLESIVANVVSGTENIALASQEISEGNQNLSQRTEEQAASLEETASSMEEMASAIKQTSENAMTANNMVKDTQSATKRGVEAVKRTIDQMTEISEASQKISDITKVIENIAFQTNILALNAAVEAARAGEQGKGFAVVASEVRTLAQNTSASVKDIGGLIQNSVDKIKTGNKEVEALGSALNEINEGVNRVVDIMNEISSASLEQQNGVEQVNKAVTDMDTVTQQNASLVEEAASSSEEMSSQAEELASTMQFFTVRSKTANAALRTKNKTTSTQKSVAHLPAPVGRDDARKNDEDKEFEEF